MVLSNSTNNTKNATPINITPMDLFPALNSSIPQIKNDNPIKHWARTIRLMFVETM